MKGNDRFYLLLFLENDKSRISFKVLTQDRQIKRKIKVTEGLQLWSVIKEINI